MTPSWASAARLPNLALGWCFWMSHWTVPAALAAGASKKPAETAKTANAFDILTGAKRLPRRMAVAVARGSPCASLAGHRVQGENWPDWRLMRERKAERVQEDPSFGNKQQTIDKRICLSMWKCGLGAGLIRRRTASGASAKNVSELGRGQRRRGAHGAQWLDWEFEARKTKEKPRERRRAKA